jgi:hypothetical protein
LGGITWVSLWTGAAPHLVWASSKGASSLRWASPFQTKIQGFQGKKCKHHIIRLVVLTILKNMKVNGKDYPIYEMENKKCSKPPTSHNLIHNYSHVAGFGITD